MKTFIFLICTLSFGLSPNYALSQEKVTIDADKVVKFCAQRLGYPIENVELQDINFYAAFEEAITVYANELYGFKIRDNYLTFEGADASTIDPNESIVVPNLNRIIQISKQYQQLRNQYARAVMEKCNNVNMI